MMRKRPGDDVDLSWWACEVAELDKLLLVFVDEVRIARVMDLVWGAMLWMKWSRQASKLQFCVMKVAAWCSGFKVEGRPPWATNT
jgi:hypothetical protein